MCGDGATTQNKRFSNSAVFVHLDYSKISYSGAAVANKNKTKMAAVLAEEDVDEMQY